MIASAPIRIVTAWMAAVVLAYLLAATFATGAVVLALRRLEVPLDPGTVFGMVLHDWAGMTGIFLPAVAIGLALALPVAAGLARHRPEWRIGLAVLAGAVALVAVHLILKASFGITPVAVARTIPGLLSQAVAGAAGGGLYAVLRLRRP
ncbi:hypothetical protein [Elongatibacter sediminis]|uniref:Uncharacterized protein n=1 Tax=Elongatibacter sediminis TaxID=3119006 RepID=A0AAW9RI68_9GAMM